MKTNLLKSYLNHTHSLLLLLAFLMMAPLAMNAQTTQLVQVTSLEVGEKYVITCGDYAMSNTVDDTSNDHYVTAVSFSSSNTPATSIQWTIESGNATSGYIFKNVANSKYIGMTSDEYISIQSTGVALRYDGTDLINDVDSEGYYYTSLNSGNSYFTTSKNTGQNIVIYKLVTNYNITLTQPAGGTISVSVAGGTATTSSTTAQVGQSVTLTATENSGYTFDSWNVTGVTGTANGNTYTFTMPSNNVTVSAVFDCTTPADPTFSVPTGTYTTLQNVSISCATAGATIYYTTDGSTPTNSSTQYTGAVTINETTTLKAIAYIGTCTSNVTTATYTMNLPTYTVTCDPTLAGGSISASPTSAVEGTTITITATPGNGYFLGTITATDANNNEVTVTVNGNEGTFTMPASNVTVTATFTQGFNITLDQTEHGTISADQTTNVAPGAQVTLTATPDNGCVFQAWYAYKTGNPRDVVAVISNTTIIMPASDVTVQAIFVTEEEHEANLGDGTSTNNYIPTYVRANYSLTQQIYLASELDNQKGRITKIAYRATTTAATRNLTIYMAHTDKNEFTYSSTSGNSWNLTYNSTDWEVMGSVAKVFEGSVAFGTSDWTTITLDTPFEYDGESNINICVVDNTGSTAGSNWSYTQFYRYSGTNRALYVNGSSSYANTVGYSSQLSNTTGTRINYVNRINITMMVPGSAESLTLSPGTMADFSYVENHGPSHTEKLDIVGVDLQNNITLNAPTNFEISLTEDGTYASSLTVPRETGSKGRGVTTWDFENGLQGWTALDADGDGYGWVLGSACGGVYLEEEASLTEGHTGTGLVVSGSYSNVSDVGPLTPDNWLISPQINELGGSFSMWAKAQNAPYPAEHFGIYVSTTGTNTSDFTLLDEWTLTSGSWKQFSVDLGLYSGQQGYIAVRHFNCTDQFMIDVDDFELDTEGTITIEMPVVVTPATVFVRMKENLNVGDYSGTLTGSAGTGDNLNGIVNLSGKVLSNLPWTANVTSMPTGFDESNIDSPEDLAWLISVVNGYNGHTAIPDIRAKLTADIDMSEHVWVPIGYGSTNKFTGVFDGNYHTIKGIHITTETPTGSSLTEIEAVRHNHGTIENVGLFGYTDGATIKNTFVTGGTLVTGSNSNMNIGGIVGNATNSTTIEFCESAANLTVSTGATGAKVGGIAGSASGNITAVMAVGNITITGTASNAGAITGTGGTVNTFYANQTISGEGTVTTKNTTGTNGYTVFASGSTSGYVMGTTGFSAPDTYTYGHIPTNNTVTENNSYTPLVKKLSAASGYKWMRSTSSAINGDYPIIVKEASSGSKDGEPAINAVVNENGNVIRYGNINDLLDNYKGASYSVFMYGNDNLTEAPTNGTKLYIDENVALTQADGLSISAYTGITLKNGGSLATGSQNRTWHFFSSPLTAAPIGLTYADNAAHNPYDTQHPEDSHTVYPHLGNINTEVDSYIPNDMGYTASEGNVTSNGTYMNFDLYSYYEPDYHWINLKRNGASHYHQDGNHPQINYNGNKTNETEFVKGKGYMFAIGDAEHNEVFVQSNGTLNNGIVTNSTITRDGDELTGYNFLGNPYQSYLDFQKFANNTNNSGIWSDASHKGYVIYDGSLGGFVSFGYDLNGIYPSQGAISAGQYINMHQGFMVISDGSANTATFDNTMRAIDQTPHFRGEQPAFPLVNLIATDSEGKNDFAVVEFNRPVDGGVRKLTGLYYSDASVYIHYNDTDLGMAFIEGTPEYVPVWFKAAEDGVFTMTWSTANGDFSTLRLIDNLTGANIDMLTTESYSFQAKPSDSKARFRLVFSALGIEEETTESAENFAFFNGEELIVTGEGELSMIDLNGRVLVTEYLSGQQSHITLPNVAVGMYMLRLTNNKDVKVQKIVVRK